MTAVLIGVGVLGGLGLVLGLLLTVANKVFEIPSDPKRDAVRNALPGANCGGCGFAGCDALADAIAAGKAPVNACPVGGACDRPRKSPKSWVWKKRLSRCAMWRP